jgi:hypothetical protein
MRIIRKSSPQKVIAFNDQLLEQRSLNAIFKLIIRRWMPNAEISLHIDQGSILKRCNCYRKMLAFSPFVRLTIIGLDPLRQGLNW